MLYLVAAVGLLLVAFDLYVSHTRIRKYGPLVELNPVARQLSLDFSPKVGLAFLLAYNLTALGFLVALKQRDWLDVFVGAKAGLSACQLRSLQIETAFERILARAKEKRNVQQSSSNQ